MKQTKQMVVAVMGVFALMAFGFNAEAKTVRATEITAQLLFVSN